MVWWLPARSCHSDTTLLLDSGSLIKRGSKSFLLGLTFAEVEYSSVSCSSSNSSDSTESFPK
eukprot:732170-Rhodomonas_salina.1